MENFICRRCGQPHPFETLMEFPLPDDISDITSGRKKGELKTIFNQSYLVDRTYVLTKCSLRINILDLPDELELQTWVRIEREELQRAIQLSAESEELIVVGKLVYPIPFYSMSDYPVVRIDLAAEALYPTGKLVFSSEAFRRDWHDGISTARLEEILSDLHHV